MWVFFEKKYISRSPRLYVVNKLTTFVVLFSFFIVSDHTLLNFVKKSSKSFCVIDNFPSVPYIRHNIHLLYKIFKTCLTIVYISYRCTPQEAYELLYARDSRGLASKRKHLIQEMLSLSLHHSAKQKRVFGTMFCLEF